MTDPTPLSTPQDAAPKEPQGSTPIEPMVLEHPMPLQKTDYIVWVLVGCAFVALFYALSPILMPFMAAALMAYVMEPVVVKLDRYRIPRPLAALVILVILTLFVGLVASLVLPLILYELIPVIEKIPELPVRIQQFLVSHWPNISWEKYFNQDFIKTVLIEQRSAISSLLVSVQQALIKSGGSVLTLLANVLLFPVVFFYLMLIWPTLTQKMSHLLPPKFRQNARTITHEIDLVLGEYLHGQILVMLALCLYYGSALSLINLPQGLSLGILTGLLVLIPYIGFAVGFALSLLVAVLHGDMSLVGYVALVFGAGQVIESYVLTPYLVGERIGLHPLAVIFALLAFGQLFGFIGILMALPASAVFLVLLRHLRHHYYQSRFYKLS